MNSSRDFGGTALRPKGAEVGVAHVDGETDIDDAGEEAESGKRKIVKMQSPVTPSSADVEEHNLTPTLSQLVQTLCQRKDEVSAPPKKGQERGGRWDP